MITFSCAAACISHLRYLTFGFDRHRTNLTIFMRMTTSRFQVSTSADLRVGCATNARQTRDQFSTSAQTLPATRNRDRGSKMVFEIDRVCRYISTNSLEN